MPGWRGLAALRPARPPITLLFAGAVTALVAVAGVVGAAAATAKPGITLQVSPASQSTARGQSAVYALSVSSTGGFTGAVTLAASGLPGGATAAFAPQSVTLGSGGTASANLTVTTSTSTPVGSYTLTATGTSGKVTGSVTAGLTVNLPLSGSLSMSATPDTVTMAPGSTAAYTVALSRVNLPGPVTFAVVGGLPAGATATYAPNPTTGTTATLQVATTSGTAAGSYTLYLTASGRDPSGQMVYSYAQVQLAISVVGRPFGIAGTLTTPLAPGVSLPLELTLTNPNSKPLSVTNLTVTIASVTRRVGVTGTCGTADYAVTQYSGPYPLTVPAGGTSSLSQLGVPPQAWPKITMIDAATNQDGCKGATLALAFSGSGQGS